MALTIKCCIENNNFGDEPLNLFLAKQISKDEVKLIDLENREAMAILGGGSVLSQALSTDIVWGSGYISDNVRVIEPPQQICSVRGPLTRQLLLSQGIACPEVYGDLALLLPRFHNPKVEKKYALGVIPHYIDKTEKNVKRLQRAGCKIIDICSGLENVIRDILSCERIVSSTLHGIIVADAYGVPAMWVEFSDKVCGKGFKFLDYFASVHRTNGIPFKVTSKTSLKELNELFTPYKINIDLDLLYNACPYKPLTPKPIRIVFRNDDVGPNTKFEELYKLYSFIKTKYPVANIYSCVYLLESNQRIPTTPKINFEVTKMFDLAQLPKLYTIVSHGLMHFAHARESTERQEFSILTSRFLLKTQRFLPPFVEWNSETERICKNHGISIIGKEPWRSLDREDFDSSHPYWLFHSGTKPLEQWINKINADKNANKS
jgi:pyruvyltransferase